MFPSPSFVPSPLLLPFYLVSLTLGFATFAGVVPFSLRPTLSPYSYISFRISRSFPSSRLLAGSRVFLFAAPCAVFPKYPPYSSAWYESRLPHHHSLRGVSIVSAIVMAPCATSSTPSFLARCFPSHRELCGVAQVIAPCPSVHK